MQQQQPTDWTGSVPPRPLLHHAGQGQVQRLPDSQAPRVPRLGAPRRDAQTHAALRRQITSRQSCARYSTTDRFCCVVMKSNRWRSSS